jgi:hypothetical protein
MYFLSILSLNSFDPEPKSTILRSPYFLSFHEITQELTIITTYALPLSSTQNESTKFN